MKSLVTLFLAQMEKIEDYRNKTYLLLISGGVDSMVLFNLFLNHFVPKKLSVLHVNYKLRNEESDAQADLVLKISQESNVNFYNVIGKIDKQSSSIQSEARNIRFNEVEKLFNKYKFDYCATAHHADDQIETFLFRLFRGTGISGASSFDFINKQRRIIRPLLFSAKSEILQFAEENNVEYIDDSSNNSDVYTRNWLRNAIYPQLDERFSGCREKVLNFISDLKICSSFISESIRNVLDERYEENGNIIFDRKKFIELHELLQNEIIRDLYKKINGSYNNLTREIISNCRDMINNSINPQAKINLPENLILARDYGKIIFCKNYKLDDITFEFESEELLIDTVVVIRDLQFLVTRVEKDDDYPGKNCFPESSLVFPLTIRTRKDGDRINGRSRRKLKRVFIDMKIQRMKRDNLLLITDVEKVLWAEEIGFFHQRKKSNEINFLKIEIKDFNKTGI